MSDHLKNFERRQKLRSYLDAAGLSGDESIEGLWDLSRVPNSSVAAKFLEKVDFEAQRGLVETLSRPPNIIIPNVKAEHAIPIGAEIGSNRLIAIHRNLAPHHFSVIGAPGSGKT